VPVEYLAVYSVTDDQLWTVSATSESIFIQSLEIMAHCDVFDFLLYTNTLYLFTYLLSGYHHHHHHHQQQQHNYHHM